ncbi:Cytochrome P450 [Talaromyces atroroseus]|uniref:sterol 22-desaturase n=1 Tax=Talaromyces atroroseus TaxID=1441469 RepID=A0A225B0G7_TALAT|nr:Cytochrome P450 [Talaromyces atroroseus]OKL59277.1 Cytochrome P450 [Talaromyces atroroseus]
MVEFNGSFASPLADASVVAQLAGPSGALYNFLNGLTVWSGLLYLFLAAVVYDQVKYIYLKGSIVGPAMKIPFMGPFLDSMDPKFHEYLAKWNSGSLSCVSVFHKFVVIASTRDLSRKIFNSPMYVKPCVVDAAHKLLGATNWVFLDGKAHVEFRKGLNVLFTRHALSLYLPGQDEVYDKYFKHWAGVSASNDLKPIPFMSEFREFMTAISCKTFVGDYMTDDTVKKIADDYYLITAALELVNFPIIIPFTKTWYGKKASDMVLEEFRKCAVKSKAHIAAGGEVTCIMDGWVKAQQESAKYREKLAKGIPVDDSEKPASVLRDFTDYEIAQTVFTFLFASQDATSAACTWLFQLMADRPDILDKVREENYKLRNGDRNAPLTMDLLENMTYTRAVVKETLRYRPPVIMVPYIAKKDFPITETYTVPKGSMIIPSVYPSTHDPEAYEDPDTFNPDRWITGTAESQSKNWLVFGTGPHYCLGQTYATHNLMGLIGKASMHLNWEHHPTPQSEEIKVFATIFPKDDCHLVFTPRD